MILLWFYDKSRDIKLAFDCDFSDFPILITLGKYCFLNWPISFKSVTKMFRNARRLRMWTLFVQIRKTLEINFSNVISIGRNHRSHKITWNHNITWNHRKSHCDVFYAHVMWFQHPCINENNHIKCVTLFSILITSHNIISFPLH